MGWTPKAPEPLVCLPPHRLRKTLSRKDRDLLCTHTRFSRILSPQCEYAVRDRVSEPARLWKMSRERKCNRDLGAAPDPKSVLNLMSIMQVGSSCLHPGKCPHPSFKAAGSATARAWGSWTHVSCKKEQKFTVKEAFRLGGLAAEIRWSQEDRGGM